MSAFAPLVGAKRTSHQRRRFMSTRPRLGLSIAYALFLMVVVAAHGQSPSRDPNVNVSLNPSLNATINPNINSSINPQ